MRPVVTSNALAVRDCTAWGGLPTARHLGVQPDALRVIYIKGLLFTHNMGRIHPSLVLSALIELVGCSCL